MSTRAAFARPGPDASPFPEVAATLQPSESPAPSVAAPVPLATAYHGQTLVLCHAAHASDALHVGVFVGGSPDRIYRGETRASQVTGPSSSRVPWSSTPRRCAAASPTIG